jgi:hypothetical protein
VKDDNSDANGKGGNKHDREDKDKPSQEIAEDKKDEAVDAPSQEPTEDEAEDKGGKKDKKDK